MTTANPLADALHAFADAVPYRATGAETVPLAEAAGRVLAATLTAPEDAPPYHRAIVEGFAIHLADTKEASAEHPVILRIVGRVNPGDAEFPLFHTGEAVQVATGSIMPDGPFAVARMFEVTVHGGTVSLSRPFPPRFFIEEKGCDHTQGSPVVSAGTRLGPVHIGTIASLGIDTVTVARRPRVAIFSSGDEVIPHTSPMRPGAIRDGNQPMLAAAVAQAGAIPAPRGIMGDDFDGFVAAVKAALADSDMVLISGGTAVGGRDFISDLVKAVGTLVVDGVPMRSGRPLIMGVADGKPLVCVAGHPPEALRGFGLFGMAALTRLTGHDAPLPADG
ncbi:MAG: molybdopterin molybdotransferase MoeA [Nitrospirae bacterium]|nr:molybdopterin molybdotransferase MoeA [Nitrospirota bacterium]